MTVHTTTLRSMTKKLAAGAAIGASVLCLGAGAAAAGPFDFPPPPLPSPSPIPLVPAERPATDTHERPFMRSSFCAFADEVWIDFHDPDGSDLRMDVEIGYRVGSGRYQVTTMTYSKPVDGWIATIPDGANSVVVQATDEDGYHSLGVFLDTSEIDCEPKENHFNNDKDIDIFGVLGGR